MRISVRKPQRKFAAEAVPSPLKSKANADSSSSLAKGAPDSLGMTVNGGCAVLETASNPRFATTAKDGPSQKPQANACLWQGRLCH